jgi:hypothetical protein
MSSPSSTTAIVAEFRTLGVVDGERPTRYRQPWTTALPFFVLFVVFGPPMGRLVMAAPLLGVAQLIRSRRIGLDLTDEDAVVHFNRLVRIPWPEVSAVRPGPRLRGGLLLLTASGREVWAPAPCSWWGGPALPEQVAEVTGWWVDHRGPSWTPPTTPPSWWPPPVLVPAKPRTWYRPADAALPMAVVGLVSAALNSAALDELGWLALGAAAAGAGLGVIASRLVLSWSSHEPPAGAREGNVIGPVTGLLAVAIFVAGAHATGLAPETGPLVMVALGLALAVAAVPLAVTARRHGVPAQ